MSSKSYDIAVSFAGEQRSIAAAIVKGLKARGWQVFYDEHEQARLWGANLQEELLDVYMKDARYCLVLVSREYVDKEWPNHERQAALAGSLTERQSRVWAVSLDGSELPGLLPTIGYLDFRKVGVERLIALADEKLRQHADTTASRTAGGTPTISLSDLSPGSPNASLGDEVGTTTLMEALRRCYGLTLSVDWDQRSTQERCYRLNIALALIVALRPTTVHGSRYPGSYDTNLVVDTFKRGRFRNKTKDFNCDLPFARVVTGQRPSFVYLNPLLYTNTRDASALLAVLQTEPNEFGREIEVSQPRCALIADAFWDALNAKERESIKAFKAIGVPHHLFSHGALSSYELKLTQNNGFHVHQHVDTVARALAAWREVIRDTAALRKPAAGGVPGPVAGE